MQPEAIKWQPWLWETWYFLLNPLVKNQALTVLRVCVKLTWQNPYVGWRFFYLHAEPEACLFQGRRDCVQRRGAHPLSLLVLRGWVLKYAHNCIHLTNSYLRLHLALNNPDQLFVCPIMPTIAKCICRHLFGANDSQIVASTKLTMALMPYYYAHYCHAFAGNYSVQMIAKELHALTKLTMALMPSFLALTRWPASWFPTDKHLDDLLPGSLQTNIWQVISLQDKTMMKFPQTRNTSKPSSQALKRLVFIKRR